MESIERLESWGEAVGLSRIVVALGSFFGEGAVFVVDAEQTILYWNERAEELLGYTASEALGFHCRKVNRCTECMMGCPLSEQKKLKQQALNLYHREGVSVELEKDGVGFFGEDGRFLGGIEILRVPRSRRVAQKELTSIVSSSLEGGGVGDVELGFGEGEEGVILGSLVKRPDFDDLGGVEKFGGLLTRNEKMRRVFRSVRNISETDATVFVHGESGTGKELVARAIHENSPRRGGPFVAVNCAALTPSLLESELFGHEKGAFTGAVSRRIGLFERAEGGTIFLDEIAELPLELQSKLLRVLEEREVLPVGGNRALGVDIRVVSASHRSLSEKVSRGEFREDLMYRLRIVPIVLPSLQERREDIELLTWHFIELYNRRGFRVIREISKDAMYALLRYRWPGNVRELRNAFEYAFAVGRGEVLLLEELPSELLVKRKVEKKKASEVEQEPGEERERLRDALEQTLGHVGQAAELLGMSRATLWRKRKKLGV